MPRLSIVIPCLGGAAEFDGTLVSVLQNRPADCEVLVVHREAYDDPYQLAEEVQFLHTNGRTLVELMNAAIQRASGDILHVVGCGLEVTEGWTDAALPHFADSEVAAVTPLVLDSNQCSLFAGGLRWSLGGTRRVVKDRRLMTPGSGRLRASVLGPTLSAAFYRRDMLVALDGLDDRTSDELADVELALAIQSLGRLNVCEPDSRLIRGEAIPVTAGGSPFVIGRGAERLFWRYAVARGIFASLVLHTFAIAAEMAKQLPSPAALGTILGRAFSLLEVGANQRHIERLALAKERLAEWSEPQSTVRLPVEREPRNSAGAETPRRRAA